MTTILFKRAASIGAAQVTAGQSYTLADDVAAIYLNNGSAILFVGNNNPSNSSPAAFIGSDEPTAQNDEVDSAGIGTSFIIGSHWFVSGSIYICTDASANAAVWVNIAAF